MSGSTPTTTPTGAPTVSVVLPCYNAHRDLPRALDSVRAQTFRDLEIIVVDDGSTDPETVAFLDALPDDVRLVRQQNRGLPGARNTGFRKARGRYVLPLDCDDWLDPSFVGKAVERIAAADGPAFVFANLRMFGEASGALHKNFNFFEQLFFNQLPYCMLIPRALWQEVGGYDETMRDGYEDWEFNIRLAAHGATGLVIEEPLFNYHVSAGGMLGSTSRRQHARLWQAIRARHADIFRLPSLVALWRQWHGRPSTRVLCFYFFWNLLYLALPNAWLSNIVRLAFGLSHSRRAALVERDIESDEPARFGRLGQPPDATLPTADPGMRGLLERTGVFLALAPAIVSRSANYLILIIAAWTLAADQFGVFAALWVVGGLAGAVVSGGGDMWLNRFSTPYMSRRGRVPSIWLFYLVGSGLLSLAALLVTLAAITLFPGVAKHGAAVLLAVLAFSVAGFGETLLALVRASGRVSLFFLLRDFAAPASFLLIVLVSLPGQAGEIFLVYGIIWAVLSTGTAVWLGIERRRLLSEPVWRLRLVAPLVRHTALMVFSNLSSRVLAYVDVLALTGFVSLALLGEYRVAAQFAIGFIVVQHFAFLSLPWQLRMTGGDDARRVARFRAAEQQRTLVLLGALALVVAEVFAPLLLGLFGERFVDTVEVFRALLLIRFLELLWGPQHEVLISNGLVREDATANLVGIAAWLALFFVGHQFVGPVWSALLAVAGGSLAAQTYRALVIVRSRVYCPRLLA